MSNTQNALWLEGKQEDFDVLLAKENWAGARAIIDELGENGFENEALFLHKALNRAKLEWLEEESKEEENTAYETGKYQDVRDLNIY